MAVYEIVRQIKKIHKVDVVLVRIGKFLHAYGKDSYILSFLFGYKLQKLEDNIYMCGFPDKIENKVIAKLENRKINYLIVDRRNEYEVEERTNFKGLNKYEEIYDMAKEYINLKSRIDKIYEYLINNMQKKETKQKIREIENIIETKKVIKT